MQGCIYLILLPPWGNMTERALGEKYEKMESDQANIA
jgi:hypothetical protein